MLVVKKNLRVSERFPYPVRVEAVLELIDQFPVRKLEKMTRRGPHVRLLLSQSITEILLKKLLRICFCASLQSSWQKLGSQSH